MAEQLKLSDILPLLTEDERSLPIAAAIVNEMLDKQGRVITPRCVMLLAKPIIDGKIEAPWSYYPIERVLVSGAA